MIIAIDFDGVIVEHEFPQIGKPIVGAIETLKYLKNCGYKLILWTSRENTADGNWLDEAVEYCKQNGVEFDAVNDNINGVSYITSNGKRVNCRKVYADVYIDDCNFLYKVDWKIVEKYIRMHER